MRVVQFGLGAMGLAMASTPLDAGVNLVATDYSALYLTLRSGESA